jgi:hypothetical protein
MAVMTTGHGSILAIAALAFVAACHDDVQLEEPGIAFDAAVADGAAIDSATPPLPLGDAAATCDGSPPPACRPLGDPCGATSDCCSNHCASGACVAPGACAGAGVTCSAASDCCSGLCEPIAGSAARACLAECRPAGASCTRASDCCDFACNGGVCGGTECLREGEDCAVDADCCSNECDPSSGGRCVVDPVAACRSSADDCTSGGGAPCCGTCDDAVKRCDPGPGPCRPNGTICTSDADCCHGTCTDDGTGRTVCTAPCVADGASCAAGFECCSGACIGDPPVCGTAAAACSVTGAACDAGDGCCSGVCAAGQCQAQCSGTAR